jgi:hypothetical protein
MYCPRCSQPTVDGVRFCSGCGFQLDLVAQLLSQNGALLVNPGDAAKGTSLLRKKGVRRGAKIVFVSVFLLPVAVLFSAAVDSPGPLVVPFFVFLIGLATSLYSMLFGSEQRGGFTQPQFGSAPVPNRFAMPAARPGALNTFNRPNTAEMMRPPRSVTEHTTKFLDDEKIEG